MEPYREFTLHLRCCNCVRPHARTALVPKVEGAPSSVDEFLNSAAMTSVPFRCKHCESESATLIAVTMVGPDDISEAWEAGDETFSDVA